jgi:hypothetical protein
MSGLFSYFNDMFKKKTCKEKYNETMVKARTEYGQCEERTSVEAAAASTDNNSGFLNKLTQERKTGGRKKSQRKQKKTKKGKTKRRRS